MMRLWFIAALAALILPAGAEEALTSGLSQDLVQISSTYTGTDLVIFGAIEQPEPDSTRDIVVVVRGPDAGATIRRKDRIAGVWINDARARLYDVPSYYFLAGTRPLGEIANVGTLRLYDLGLANVRPGRTLSDGAVEPYRQALLRDRMGKGLYTQQMAGVEMLSPTLFRVHVPVPATVPRGQYNVQVYLFKDGAVISAQSTPLFVDQTGFERQLYFFAHEWPLSYGLLTVFLAVLLGWLASVLFRKFG